MRLDGLPLALELAAANIKWLPVQAMRERLGTLHKGTALELLSHGARDLPMRQQTLRQAIAWSYDLLSGSEKGLFARLGVFVDGWTLELAEQLSQAAGRVQSQVMEELQVLVNHSLVRSPDPNASKPHWSMLETLREFALEQLEVSGEAESMRARHAIVMMEWVQKTQTQVSGTHQKVWLDMLEQEHENLRAALKWSANAASSEANEICVRLANMLTTFWYTRGYLSEAREWLGRGLALSEMGMTTHAETLLHQGMFAYRQGDLPIAEMLVEQALHVYRQLGDAAGRGQTLFFKGMIQLSAGKPEPARKALEASRDAYREIKPLEERSNVLYGMGVYFLQTGDLTQAKQLLSASLLQMRATGDRSLLAYALLGLARAAYTERDYTRAQEDLEEALGVLEEAGDKIEIAQALCRLGNVARLQADWTTANARYYSSFTLAVEYGANYTLPQVIEGLAGVAVRQGDTEKAARLLGAAERLRGTSHIPIAPADREDYERIVTAVRERLAADHLLREWHHGRTLDLREIGSWINQKTK